MFDFFVVFWLATRIFYLHFVQYRCIVHGFATSYFLGQNFAKLLFIRYIFSLLLRLLQLLSMLLIFFCYGKFEYLIILSLCCHECFLKFVFIFPKYRWVFQPPILLVNSYTFFRSCTVTKASNYAIELSRFSRFSIETSANSRFATGAFIFEFALKLFKSFCSVIEAFIFGIVHPILLPSCYRFLFDLQKFNRRFCIWFFWVFVFCY